MFFARVFSSARRIVLIPPILHVIEVVVAMLETMIERLGSIPFDLYSSNW